MVFFVALGVFFVVVENRFMIFGLESSCGDIILRWTSIGSCLLQCTKT
jgi:hypothetical protein